MRRLDKPTAPGRAASQRRFLGLAGTAPRLVALPRLTRRLACWPFPLVPPSAKPNEGLVRIAQCS